MRPRGQLIQLMSYLNDPNRESSCANGSRNLLQRKNAAGQPAESGKEGQNQSTWGNTCVEVSANTFGIKDAEKGPAIGHYRSKIYHASVINKCTRIKNHNSAKSVRFRTSLI